MTIICKEPYHALSNMELLDGYPRFLNDSWMHVSMNDSWHENSITSEDSFVAEFVKNFTESGNAERKARIFRFAETPIMSTYLVAAAVTTFEHVETKMDDGLLIRCVNLFTIISCTLFFYKNRVNLRFARNLRTF